MIITIYHRYTTKGTTLLKLLYTVFAFLLNLTNAEQ